MMRTKNAVGADSVIIHTNGPGQRIGSISSGARGHIGLPVVAGRGAAGCAIKIWRLLRECAPFAFMVNLAWWSRQNIMGASAGDGLRRVCRNFRLCRHLSGFLIGLDGAELGPLDEVSQTEPVVVSGDPFGARPGARVIRAECCLVAVEKHRERNAADVPVRSDAAAETVFEAPGAQRANGFAGFF
jgi:hypothetical protein